jgi:hypothetical protein
VQARVSVVYEVGPFNLHCITTFWQKLKYCNNLRKDGISGSRDGEYKNDPFGMLQHVVWQKYTDFSDVLAALSLGP